MTDDPDDLDYRERFWHIAGDATKRLCELEATSDYNADTLTPAVAWIDGYIEGHRAARDEHDAAHPDANSDPR